MYIQRILDLHKILKEKSVLMLGPRQTGKSSFLREEFADAVYINLLYSDTFLLFSREPQRLRQQIRDNKKIVIIDEIQKIPQLLDEVHALIEEKKIRFILTGSSARKLKRSGVNLLGGRARTKYFHPFCYPELRHKYDLVRAANYGLLPSVYFSEFPDDALADYTGTYLKEEVAAEGLTRNVGNYSRFLEVAGLVSGQLLNYAKVANDSQLSVSTVKNYFGILYDTLLGYEVPAWTNTQKRKSIEVAKFYLFDSGIVRNLQNRSFTQLKSPEFGVLFEQLIFHELKTYIDYNAGQIHYWRSTSQFEVDFILNNEWAIEVKAKFKLSKDDFKGLRALHEEKYKFKRYIVVSLESHSRIVDDYIECIPWEKLLKELWNI